MDQSKDTPEERVEREFISWLRRHWQDHRNASHGAAISLVNTGDAHTATFDCAVKVREVAPQFYDERGGYPRVIIPNQEMHKTLGLLKHSAALLDYANIAKGVTKLVTLTVVRPHRPEVVHAPMEFDAAKVEQRVMRNFGTAPNSVLQRQASDLTFPKRKVRDRGDDQPALNFSGTQTGRTDSSKPNESAKPQPGQNKKVIRER